MTPIGNHNKGIVMKLSISPITSASNLVPVALATALLVFGIVMCAVAVPPSPTRSPGTATSSSTLYVDCAATSRGNGNEAHPYGRIPDALEQARLFKSDDCHNMLIRLAPRVELQVERNDFANRAISIRADQ